MICISFLIQNTQPTDTRLQNKDKIFIFPYPSSSALEFNPLFHNNQFSYTI